jgi:hypothetical protein
VLLTVVALHPRTAELVAAGARGARERVGEAADRRRTRRAEEAEGGEDFSSDDAALSDDAPLSDGTVATSDPAGRPTGRWHAVTTAETPAEHSDPAASAEPGETPARAGRDGAPSAPGRWSGPSLSDWERPERD